MIHYDVNGVQGQHMRTDQQGQGGGQRTRQERPGHRARASIKLQDSQVHPLQDSQVHPLLDNETSLKAQRKCERGEPCSTTARPKGMNTKGSLARPTKRNEHEGEPGSTRFHECENDRHHTTYTIAVREPCSTEYDKNHLETLQERALCSI